MAVGLFNAKSPRAYKARLGKALKPWAISFELGVVVLLLGGAALILLGFSLGWIVLGFAAVPGMIVEWYKRELIKVPPVKDGTMIDDLLEAEILALLPAQPSPQDIATAFGQTNSGQFFAVRFGLSSGFFQQVMSAEREDTATVFQQALNIQKQVGGTITAGVLMLAMIRQFRGKDTVLGHLQLEENDILNGIRWYNRLQYLIDEQANAPKRPGGIGRDWSFGWIPTLSRFGQNVSQQISPLSPTGVHDDTVNHLVSALAEGRSSLALVGQTGTGKTEAVYELAWRLMYEVEEVPSQLRYHQVFMLDASRLLAQAGEAGQLEQLVNIVLGEAFAAKNIIVCLDNAHLFFEEGIGSVDITNVLLPILEAGRLPLILTLDEQRFLQISKRTPALANALQRLSLQPMFVEDTMLVMQDQLISIEFKNKTTYMYQALKQAYTLGARYVYDVAMPGQAISLLESASQYAEEGLVTARSVSQAIEQTIGVKTAAVSDDDEREKLLNMEDLIHQRMIGQSRAVSVVSDALRRARAGVRNQDKPVGTFLFLGPTGVGKTELAKSLAAVYFGGEDKIIRLDMNEFVSPDDVARLIADGATDANSLTARVMKQPFSVILLDEIEKAHSSVLTTLLQLLDEGIMRDVNNREVNFRDTIVIATSNAGADRIQEYLARGYDLEKTEDVFVDELISTHVFHTEFLNRFDEIIVFAPLSKPELLQVVDLILADVNKNLAQQKITVEVADDAKEYLVEAGYDPRLGARPMRRVVQRAVENTVANLLLAGEATPGQTISLTLEQVRAIIDKKKQADDA